MGDSFQSVFRPLNCRERGQTEGSIACHYKFVIEIVGRNGEMSKTAASKHPPLAD
jgi:hypothetical protein